MHPADKLMNDLQKYWIDQNRAWLQILGLLEREPTVDERRAALGLRVITGGKKVRRLK